MAALFFNVRHKYLLRKPNDADIEFYRKCFFDDSWRSNYGYEQSRNAEEILQSIAFAEYPNVTRFLVCRDSTILGFFHFETFPEDKRCILSGGILPDMMKSGNGFRGLCLVLDYIFSQLNLNKVCCEVIENNKTSSRILLGAGFQQEGILREHRFDNKSQAFLNLYLFGLLRRDYPSPIVRKIISRFDYEAE